MPVTTIPILPDAPSDRTDPAVYNTTANNWAAALPAWTDALNDLGPEVEAIGNDATTSAATATTQAGIATTKAAEAAASAASAVTAPGTQATSTSSLTVSTGTKSLTIQTAKAFSPGQSVVIADSGAPTTNWMFGQVYSYDSGSGALVVISTVFSGTGTLTTWTISISANPSAVSPLVTGQGGQIVTGNITMTVTSGVITDSAIYANPSTYGKYVTLPVATTVTTEAVTQIGIYNNGDFDYGVKDSTGLILGWVSPKTGAIIGLSDNSTSAGTWTNQGLVKVGLTAQYTNPSITSTTSSSSYDGTGSQVWIELDSDRTAFVFGNANCYILIYDRNSGWGTPTTVRTSISSGNYTAIKSATNQVLIFSCDSTTGMEVVTVSVSGLVCTVNTGTKATVALAGNQVAQMFGLPIAVGSSFIVPYLRNTTTTAIRSVTVSGTTPTVGSEQALTSGVADQPAVLFTSGSIVRCVYKFSATSLYCTPLTVSGTTLTLGSSATVTTVSGSPYKVFQNGNGNLVCLFSESAAKASIFKLTGTTEAISTVTLSSGYDPATAIVSRSEMVVISSSKTAIFTHAAGTSAGVNILTDTSGTASAGTQLSLTSNGNIGVISSAGVTGNNVRFLYTSTSSTYQLTVDCSGTSPTLGECIQSVYNSSLSVPNFSTSNRRNNKFSNTFLVGNLLFAVGTQGAPFSQVYLQSNITRANIVNLANTSLQEATFNGQDRAYERWFGVGLSQGSAGISISKVEVTA